MAIHKSAKKRIRRNEASRVINKNRVSRMRTFVRKVLEAITSGNYDAATTALKDAQPEIHRSASKGLIHKKNAARKISRLAARVKALKA